MPSRKITAGRFSGAAPFGEELGKGFGFELARDGLAGEDVDSCVNEDFDAGTVEGDEFVACDAVVAAIFGAVCEVGAVATG